ncbi:MAG: hypothetical protein IAE81_04995 [Caldilineaceae bacterium]|jgi:sirohydrochlorin cobaltochelatase|nr:hypothetical protein [Caldilineaceae bacterium]
MTTLLQPAESHSAPQRDRRAPMAAAPIAYNDDGSVAWDHMWTSFCELASVGGPPHRSDLLRAPCNVDAGSAAYHTVAAEIIRGIRLVSGLEATTGEPGWIVVECTSTTQARWLSEQINQENVESHWSGKRLFVPAGEHFTVKREVKNVITAVAKTTHYWNEHVGKEVKQAMAVEAALQSVVAWLRRLAQ